MKRYAFLKTRLLCMPIVALTAMLLSSCSKPDAMGRSEVYLPEEELTVGTTQAGIRCVYEYDTPLEGVTVVYGKDKSLDDAETVSATLTDTIFFAELTGLTVKTEYHYYYRYYSGVDYMSSAVKSFTTKDYGKPEVVTNEVAEIDTASATLQGRLLDDGGYPVTARGFCWSKDPQPTMADNVAPDAAGASTDLLACRLHGLELGTTYYVRAFATNQMGTGYGNEERFTTLNEISLPEVTTGILTDITASTATCNGNVTDDGGSPVTARGVCWSRTIIPTIDNVHTNNGSGTGVYSGLLTDLYSGTRYIVRAYATNAIGTAYGDTVSFVTNDGRPIVKSLSVGLYQETIIARGQVTDEGIDPVTERGFCWSNTPQPTLSDPHASSGTGMGIFETDIVGLAPGTTYHVRAYATNAKGTGFGNDLTYTPNVNPPTVFTNPVNAFTATTANLSGGVSDNGGGNVTERGFCYGTSPNPCYENDNHTNDGSGQGNFSTTIDDLSPNTTYYVRAYASNGQIGYGEQQSFTTSSTTPTVTTTAATNIQQTSATCGGNVTSDGGAAVTARGVKWGISQSSLNQTASASGGGTGAFSVNLTGLMAGRTYYYKAFATNANGTSHGDVVSFTTEGGQGSLPGLFSVSSTRKVRFSQGNLQYQASTGTWRFATSQYDCIGSANSSISQTYSGWIDLFGWGTSGWACGNTYYRPWDSNNSDGSLYGPRGSNHLMGSYANSDWGVYNAVSNGGGSAGQWRTLTVVEWDYLLSRRTGASQKYGLATVNGVAGLVLLPDSWTLPSGCSFVAGHGSGYSTNTYTSSQWQQMESGGAVFLPAAGDRNGSSVNYFGTRGRYWSSSYYDGYYACYLYFSSGSVRTSNYGRYYGHSVRLVQDY